VRCSDRYLIAAIGDPRARPGNAAAMLGLDLARIGSNRRADPSVRTATRAD